MVKNGLEDAAVELGFGTWHAVRDRVSVADMFLRTQRCGIYVLSFANGEAYAGQAVDVTRRYVQHRKVHNDIEGLTFQEVDPKDLNEKERIVIRGLEAAGIKLRNVVFASIPYGPSDFDLVMPEDEQRVWLADIGHTDLATPRNEDMDTRRRFARQYRELLLLPDAEEALSVLRTYARRGIPVLPRSEMTFWATSCLPGHSRLGMQVYSRINVYQQEVFTVFKESGQLKFSWHLAKSPLQRVYGRSLLRMRLKFPWVGASSHTYEPGGQDQVELTTRGTKNALRLLSDTDVLRAIRLFNLRLMLKGPCMFSRYHCFDLADRFYDSESDSTTFASV